MLSLHTLPVEMIYRILDNLSDKGIFLSLLNVSQRLNTIIQSSHRYQVNSESLITVTKFVQKCTTLNLDYCDIGNNGAKQLVQIMHANTVSHVFVFILNVLDYIITCIDHHDPQPLQQ